MTKFTQVELKIFDAWERQMPGIQIDTQIDFIREITKRTAYHEAGHATVYAFFGDNHSHFNNITIIPSQEHKGVFCQSNVYRIALDVYPARLKWIKGCSKIVELLSGRMAEKRIHNGIKPIENEIDEGWENTFAESEENWLSTCDEGKALKIAEQISKRGWPPLRILNMLEGWTDELLNIPIVWNVVDKLAQRLLVVGEITDFEEYENFVEPILYKYPDFPEWKRRMHANIQVRPG